MKKTSKMKVKDLGIKQMQMPASHKTKQGNDCVCASCPAGCSGWGLALVRVVVGFLFLLHGVQKFMDLGTVARFFSSIAIPGWMGYLVAGAEVLGGLALIIGIWTRWASYGLGVVMVGAFAFGAFQWGAIGWLPVIVAALACLGLGCNKCTKVSFVALAIVLAVVYVTAIVLQLKGGIAPKANLERDMAFLAVLFHIAWSGPGSMSMHSRCGCCE